MPPRPIRLYCSRVAKMWTLLTLRTSPELSTADSGLGVDFTDADSGLH